MIQFPWHAAALYLTHNEHKSYYQTVAQAIAEDTHGYDDDCWVSSEQRQKAIDTNECWTLQWYPKTPMRFCFLAAADLDVLLEAALKK